jgi:hypothetical protein
VSLLDWRDFPEPKTRKNQSGAFFGMEMEQHSNLNFSGQSINIGCHLPFKIFIVTSLT